MPVPVVLVTAALDILSDPVDVQWLSSRVCTGTDDVGGSMINAIGGRAIGLRCFVNLSLVSYGTPLFQQ